MLNSLMLTLWNKQENIKTIAWSCCWNITGGMGHRIIPDIWVILCNKGVEIDGDVRLINLQQIFCNPGLDGLKGTCAPRPADICAAGCVTPLHPRPFNHSLVRSSCVTTSPAQWQNYSPGECRAEHRVNHSSRQKHHGPTASELPIRGN